MKLTIIPKYIRNDSTTEIMPQISSQIWLKYEFQKGCLQILCAARLFQNIETT